MFHRRRKKELVNEKKQLSNSTHYTMHTIQWSIIFTKYLKEYLSDRNCLLVPMQTSKSMKTLDIMVMFFFYCNIMKHLLYKDVSRKTHGTHPKKILNLF